MAICLDFDWQTNEFIVYCRTTQLREKSMMAYEQTLRLFERWCMEEMKIMIIYQKEKEQGGFLHPKKI